MIVDKLLETAGQCASTIAVEDSMASLTYARMARMADVFRRIVSRHTDRPHVGIMLPASSLFPPALLGTLWAGKTAVPLNFLLSPEELGGIVKDAELDLVLTVKHFAELAGALPVQPLFAEELGLKRRMLFSYLRRLPAAPAVQPEETAVLLYTSGTTAEPKGVELTYNNLYRNCTDSINALDLHRPQTMLNILPPFHVFGLTANVLFPLFEGLTVVAIPRFNPGAVARTVRQKKVTIMMAIPSMYAALLRLKSAGADDFRSVLLAVSGGEPLSDTVRREAEQRFGLQLREGYGLTETSPVVALNTNEHHRTGSVGRIIANTKIRIVDEQGKTLPPGEDGEIHIRGAGVMRGYYKKPEQTGAVIDADGWLATGDIGRMDEDGYLFITGRAKEMLIIGGENVFPREIEAVLEEHDGVLQAAVIGVSDASRGELPVAFVLPRPEASPTELDLRAFAKQRLAGYKVPRQVIISEELPQGPTGKILKRRLRDLLPAAGA